MLQHELALPSPRGAGRHWRGCGDRPAVIVYSGKVADLEGDLAGGVVPCPGCDGPLRPWGHARGRLVRRSGGSRPWWWRPRRARCGSCDVTHVLLPARLLPRRRDGIEVVGGALVAYARGLGHRRIATELSLPPSTVRNWLRAFGRQADQLRILGTRRYYHDDANATGIDPAGSPAADAVEALGRAARATVLRFGPFDQPWAVINVITGGGLLNSRYRPPDWP